jgi:hypothetical protein
MSEADRLDSVEHGLRALLIGTQLLGDAVQEERPARYTVLMAQELRTLLEMVLARAVAEQSESDIMPDLRDVQGYLEETLYLMSNSFKKLVVSVQINAMIRTLESLL